MDIRLLGPIEASLDGRPVALGAPQQRAVLAMLALQVNQTVSADRLSEGLWGERAGRWAAAGTFGAAHLIGLDGEVNPAAVAFTTAGGAYLGWLYDHDGQRLAAPVAAHFWYDFALLMTLWVRDPDNTPLGFDVQFSF